MSRQVSHSVVRDTDILRRITSHLSARTLKSFSISSRSCADVARPFLFRIFSFTAYDADHHIDSCLLFLQEHKKVAECIRTLSLRGKLRLPLPTLSLSTVYAILDLLPNIRRLQVMGFVWEASGAVEKPTTPMLRHLMLLSLSVTAQTDSPLGLLNVVPSWDKVQIGDIDHRGEPVFLDDSTYRCAVLVIDHHPHADPAHCLPVGSSKINGLQLLVVRGADFTHASILSRLIQDSQMTLESLVIEISSTESCKCRLKRTLKKIDVILIFRWRSIHMVSGMSSRMPTAEKDLADDTRK